MGLQLLKTKIMKRVLAIETSCDETAAAVVEKDGGTVKVLSSVVASQVDLHAKTKGVVPEVAARAHVEAITFVVDEALSKVGVIKDNVDAIAATTAPGLKPALAIGEVAGRTLSMAWEKPFVEVNHILGHIAAGWVGDCKHKFPAIILVVSGGHTRLYKINENLELTLLGDTKDDAAGEAFDKIARLIGLPYPGGPALANLATKGNAQKYDFPRPMIDSKNFDFSFSGLKTAVLYSIKDRELSETDKADVAASAQEAIVDVLVSKTKEAAELEKVGEVIVVGGVAANSRLREKMTDALPDISLIVPPIEYCTDNAVMIGAAALLGLEI